MSTVRGSSTITFVKQGDTISTNLRSTKPLEQFIKKSTYVVAPDWGVADNRPKIYPVIKSSLTDTRLEPKNGTEVWKYNGTVIQFNAAGESLQLGSLAAGTFKKASERVDGDTLVPTLEICKNLASKSNINADVIDFSAEVNTGFESSVSGSIDIRIEEVEGDPYRGYISVNDGGVIDDNTSTLTLTANLMRGGSAQTTDVGYKWYKGNGDSWTAMSQTTKSIQVGGDDIDTQEIYKCEFLVGGSVVTNASIQVYDERDPLIIVPNPDGDEELSSARKTITYYPKVCKRGDSSATPVAGYTFSYMLTNSNYVTIAVGNGNSFSVTYAHGVQANGNMSLIISAEN
ncbi:MAG: hypothetical protein RR202_10615 [Bacteroidales bacterium]